MMFISSIVFKDEVTREVTAANAIYVDKNGDGNYTSIQAAIDNASTGDTIYVWAGTYSENVIINKTVSLIGNGSANTTIDGGGVGNVVTITSNWVTISGFKIINSGVRIYPHDDAGIKIRYVENITINNNNLTTNYFGIDLDNCKNIKVLNNTCFSNTNLGIYAVYSDHCIYENNTCVLSKSNSGLSIFGSKHNKISNNTCNSNKINGIWVRRSEESIIANNTCINNNDGIYSLQSHNNVYQDNYCANKQRGFVGYESHSFLIKNDIFENNRDGMELQSVYSCKLINNTCSNNSATGIQIAKADKSDIYPTNVTIIGN